MSSQALNELLARINADPEFRDAMAGDPETAAAEYALSLSEKMAIATGDADALRRLSGGDTAGYDQGLVLQQVPVTRFCTIIRTVFGCPPHTIVGCVTISGCPQTLFGCPPHTIGGGCPPSTFACGTIARQ